MTTDLKANNYMLFNYPKPSNANFANRKLFGNGALLGVYRDILSLRPIW